MVSNYMSKSLGGSSRSDTNIGMQVKKTREKKVRVESVGELNPSENSKLI